MTSMSDGPTPDRDEDRSPEGGSSRPDAGSGVELGESEGTGSTFEPEEDAEGDVEPDG
jgi:hypothetical protein